MFWARRVSIKTMAPIGLLVAMCLREDMSFTTEFTRIGPLHIGVSDNNRRIRLLQMNDLYEVVVSTGYPTRKGVVRVSSEPSASTITLMTGSAPGLLAEDARRVYREMTGRGSWTPERDTELFLAVCVSTVTSISIFAG